MDSSKTHLDQSKYISSASKNRNDKQWYKDNIDRVSKMVMGYFSSRQYKKSIERFKVYYGEFSKEDFEKVLNPYGAEGASSLVNYKYQSVLAPKMRVIAGLVEDQTLDGISIIDTNPDSLESRQRLMYDKIREYVISQIKNQIGADSIPEEEITPPPQIEKYMRFKHKEPSEKLAWDLLSYHKHRDRLEYIIYDGWVDFIVDGRQVYYVGASNNGPIIERINTFDFWHDSHTGIIEDASNAARVIFMSPEDIISRWGDEMTKREIESLYQFNQTGYIYFDHNTKTFIEGASRFRKIPVYHAQWKAPREVSILIYQDENGDIDRTIVDADYKLNKQIGDIEIIKTYAAGVYEGYKIMSGDGIYVGMGPVEWGSLDEENVHNQKLSFIGYDMDVDSEGNRMSILARGIAADYMYNVIQIQIMKILAKDRGKVIAIDPAWLVSEGVDLKTALHFMEKNGILNVNTSQTISKDLNSSVRVLDMSSIHDLAGYVQLSQYYRDLCGKLVGVAEPMEGDIKASARLSNINKTIEQHNVMLSVYMSKHSLVKRNLLQRYVDVMIDVYRNSKPRKLTSIAGDYGIEIIDVSPELLQNSQMGIFVTDDHKEKDNQYFVEQLSHAAMQNGAISLVDVIKVMKASSHLDKIAILEAALEKSSEQRQKELEAQHRMEMELKEKELQDKLRLQADEYERKERLLRVEGELEKELGSNGLKGAINRRI